MGGLLHPLHQLAEVALGPLLLLALLRFGWNRITY
jgi:hypothetical protein